LAVLERVNQFVLLFINTFRQLTQWRIWVVLLLYYGFQWLVLYVHFAYPAGPLGGLLTWWVSLFGPDMASAFSHYPQHFLLLGKISYWAKLAIGLILEGAVLGFVANLFLRQMSGRTTLTAKSSSSMGQFLSLTLVWVIINGLMLAAGQLLPRLLADYLYGPRRILAFSFVLMPFVFNLIFAVFFLAIPSVVMFRDDALKALSRSFKHFLRRPITLFFLSFIILAIPIFLGALASRPSGIVDSFKPELLYWILVASLCSEMIAGFFWMGTAVCFLWSEDH
jgi:hypothetical protein